MTQQELKNLFRSTLQAQRTIAQEYTVLDAIVDFISQALTSGIPTWTASLTFQTDGTDDGTFALYPDTDGQLRFWKTKTDNNINHEPPTNPATTETTDWIEVSPADGSAIKEWSAGVYGAGLVIVYHNHSTDGRGLYLLAEATRPYNSTNIETETTAGDWLRITEEYGAAAAAEIAAKAYADALVVGLWDDRGNFDASVNAYPSSGGSGTAGAIMKGDIWTVSVAGTLPTAQVVEAGDTVRALVDTPGNTQANWAIQQNNIGFTPENSANKDTDSTFAANSDTKYPSQKAVKTALAAKADLVTRVQSVTSAATVTPNADADDMVKITAQAEALDLANPSGTPTEGQAIVIRIKDNGTARAITYGSQYREIGVTKPSTTVISKTHYIAIVYNSTDTKWDIIGVRQEA